MSEFKVNKVSDLDDWNTPPSGGDSLLENTGALEQSGLTPQEEESSLLENVGSTNEDSLLEATASKSSQEDSKKTEEEKDQNEPSVKKQSEELENNILKLEEVTSDALVKELIEKNVLLPWEGEEVKTTQDLIDLIQENMEHKLTEVNNNIFEDKLQSLPPQYQSIIKHGLNGGQDIQSLMESWVRVEKTFNTDINTEEGQEGVVKQYLLETGYGSEAMIDKDIQTWKDLGVLKEKAEAFKPVLEESQIRKVHALEQEQMIKAQQEQQFHEYHLNTINQMLTSFKLEGMELDRETKANLFDAAQPRYQSQITGKPVDTLEAIIEELKYGQNQDPALYLELMYHAADPEGFKENIKTSIKSSIAQERRRTLQTQVRKDISGGDYSPHSYNQTSSRNGDDKW